jgi:hypothetical protein
MAEPMSEAEAIAYENSFQVHFDLESIKNPERTIANPASERLNSFWKRRYPKSYELDPNASLESVTPLPGKVASFVFQGGINSDGSISTTKPVDSKAAEVIAWNERYNNIITYIANSPTTQVRLQRIKEHTDNGELDAFRKSRIDVDGHLKFQNHHRYRNILEDIGKSPSREKRLEKYSYYLPELELMGSLGLVKDLDVDNDFYYLGLHAPFIFYQARQWQALNDRNQELLSRTQVVPNVGINTTIPDKAKDVQVGTPPVNSLFNQKIGDNIGIGRMDNRQLNLLNVEGAYDFLNVPNLRSSSVNGESPPNIKVVFGGGKVVYPTAVAIWDYAAGLGSGILGFQGEDYHDRSKVYQYGHSVGNRAMPLALEFEGIKGLSNPSIHAVGFNGTLAETMTVDAWRIGYSSSVVTGIESSRYNATKTDGSGKPTEGSSNAVIPKSINAGKPGSPEWKAAVKTIEQGKGKGVNVKANNKADAERLLKESGRDLEQKPTYGDEAYKSGYEVHSDVNQRELDVGNGLPHIKWKDWSKGKSGGAEGHIYFEK